MKTSSLVLATRLLLAASIVVLLLSRLASAAEWIVEGRVVGVSDGATITVLDHNKRQHKVRFSGIDAPEKGQPYSDASKQNLARMIFNQRAAARCYKEDRYGHEVCRVYDKELHDVGLEQIRAGLAWYYKANAQEQTAQERLLYEEEERTAKGERRGLWKDPHPVPPWEWRKKPER